MPELSYTQALEQLEAADMLALPVMNLAVLRNIMVDPIAPLCRWHAWRMGSNAQLRFGEYDNIFQEAVGESPELLNDSVDVVLVFMHLETASENLARNFPALDEGQVRAELDRLQAQMEAIVQGIRRQTRAMILWHGFESPLHPAYGIYDAQTGAGQKAAVAELNSRLRGALGSVANAYFLDMDLCVARVGGREFYDPRYWHLGRAPYSRQGLAAVAFEQAKFIRPLRGRNRKCLVLDCDNTLWGGVLGEEGLAGIHLAKTHPGSGFRDFQQEIVNLANRGVIVALCSKNNEPDVWEVFANHPDMVLRREHVAAWQINWQDKVRNLRQLAMDLNIGLDSMVFVDDSEFEVNLVRQELPEVEVLHLAKGKSAEYRELLASCGLFDTLTITAEDRKKGAMYRAEASRKQLQAAATDMESYYRSLEMVVGIGFADSFSIPRVAQQTQKTNQFNLTTRRYSESDIQAYVESPDHDVVTLQLEDRFGDSGIVGTGILEYRGDEAVFDSLLISCRVLGRGVEDAFVAHLLARAKSRGARRAVGEYLRTKKNGQVETFYARKGFVEVPAPDGRADRVFVYDLDRELPGVPGYFKAVNSAITARSKA